MKYAEFYEKIYAPRHEPERIGAFGSIRRRLVRDRQEAVFVLLDSGEKFLDVGCGFGQIVFMATQKYHEVHGTDISQDRISWNQEAAKNLDGADIYFKVSDINQGIPYEDGYFDTVTCVASLEIPSDILKTIREFNRVLKPGGQLVVFISNVAYVTRRIRALFGQPPRISSTKDLTDNGMLHYYTLRSIKRLLEHEGFTVVKVGNAGKLWFIRSWWKSLLASGLAIKAVKVN